MWSQAQCRGRPSGVAVRRWLPGRGGGAGGGREGGWRGRKRAGGAQRLGCRRCFLPGDAPAAAAEAARECVRGPRGAAAGIHAVTPLSTNHHTDLPLPSPLTPFLQHHTHTLRGPNSPFQEICCLSREAGKARSCCRHVWSLTKLLPSSGEKWVGTAPLCLPTSFPPGRRL